MKLAVISFTERGSRLNRSVTSRRRRICSPKDTPRTSSTNTDCF